MSIKITTDSTCDLPPEELARFDIEVVPLSIVIDSVPRRDGLEITPEGLFRHVDGGGAFPSTAAINIEDYRACFTRFSPQHESVIHINLGAGFSSCHQNALIAAHDFSNVYPVDSGNLSSGHGLVVLAAAHLAAEGLPAQEIVAWLQNMTPRIESSFLINRLDYLAKGGRCSSVVALGANLLGLKPCIEVVDGLMRVGKKYRGSFEKAVLEYTRDRLKGRTDLDATRIIIVEAACPDGVVDTVKEEIAKHAPFTEVHTPTAGCTISCHCGPVTLGIMFVRT